jgi:acyl carrier protein
MSMSDSFEKFTIKISDLIMIEAGELIDSNLQDLPEFDSMARINVGLLIEEEYGYQVALDDLNSLQSLSSLYDLVKINCRG